jgi:chitinase
MGDPNLHNHRRAPLVVLGGANGKLEGNLHLKAPDGTPMANAMLSLIHKLGMDDLDSFGDSTGELSFGAPSISTAMGR